MFPRLTLSYIVYLLMMVLTADHITNENNAKIKGTQISGNNLKPICKVNIIKLIIGQLNIKFPEK